GEVVRGADGTEPSGVLREGARAAMFRAIPRPTTEDGARAIGEAAAVAASKGLTGVQTFESEDTFRALQLLRVGPGLPVRVCCHLWRDGLQQAIGLGLQTGFGDETLRIGHLKLFLDGALGSHTALMLDPYEGTNDRGIQVTSREEFAASVVQAARGGIAVAVHAIGDAANRLAIDVFEETAHEWRQRGLRQRIEHVQLLADGDAARLARLGIIASMQPIHATSDWEVAERHWAGRTRLGYAWRTLESGGARLAFGSDCPVESIDPLAGLYAAVTRQTPGGMPAGGWNPQERLEPLAALRAYTIGAAFASGEEAIKGSLEAGKLADLVVLSDDPFSGPPELFLRTRVVATLLGGRLVYGEL
ncbi:MAG TPA: amidohydrolase, partial [Chloroflexota bacterium]